MFRHRIDGLPELLETDIDDRPASRRRIGLSERGRRKNTKSDCDESCFGHRRSHRTMYCTRVVAAQVRVWWYYAVPLNHTNKTHPSRAMQPPKLLDQVRTVLRVKHFSLSTERAYANWIKRFILFHHKRHPRE